MRDVPCHDLNIISMTGIQNMTGMKDGPPVIPSVLIADTATGTLAALAIVSALWQRAKKGTGQYLDVSMYDSCFAWQHIHTAQLMAGFEYGAGEGMLSGAAPCYNLYRAADGRYISIGAVEPHFWIGICKTLNREDLIDKQFSQGEEAETAKAELKKIFITKTSGQWMEILEPAGLCVAPVLSLRESLEHPQARHRKTIISSESNGFRISQLNCPIRGAGLDGPVAGNGPGLGEHNLEVFMEIGMNRQDIDDFHARGAFNP
jgi:crotonobetainyl-CoA:carnitine CoA-transferase CaiB-like acyl-CoA transferase